MQEYGVEPCRKPQVPKEQLTLEQTVSRHGMEKLMGEEGPRAIEEVAISKNVTDVLNELTAKQ